MGRDGHGYDGCTCKEKIVERGLLLWYVCIRKGGGGVTFEFGGYFWFVYWFIVEKGEVSFVCHMFHLDFLCRVPF